MFCVNSSCQTNTSDELKRLPDPLPRSVVNVEPVDDPVADVAATVDPLPGSNEPKSEVKIEPVDDQKQYLQPAIHSSIGDIARPAQLYSSVIADTAAITDLLPESDEPRPKVKKESADDKLQYIQPTPNYIGALEPVQSYSLGSAAAATADLLPEYDGLRSAVKIEPVDDRQQYLQPATHNSIGDIARSDELRPAVKEEPMDNELRPAVKEEPVDGELRPVQRPVVFTATADPLPEYDALMSEVKMEPVDDQVQCVQPTKTSSCIGDVVKPVTCSSTVDGAAADALTPAIKDEPVDDRL